MRGFCICAAQRGQLLAYPDSAMDAPPSPALLDFNDALALVLRHVCRHCGSGRWRLWSLQHSRGRVLAEALAADRDQPPFRSLYTRRLRRSGGGVECRSCRRHRIAARGRGLDAGALPSKSAIEIMTGAPVPAGADAVVMLEHVSAERSHITLQPGARSHAGENIVATGSEARRGETLLVTWRTALARRRSRWLHPAERHSSRGVPQAARGDRGHRR